jgi:hypothetical protein
VKDERTYLLHAITAIDAIQSYTVGGREAFFADGKTQDAVIRNIEIIGQAVKGISGALPTSLSLPRPVCGRFTDPPPMALMKVVVPWHLDLQPAPAVAPADRQ